MWPFKKKIIAPPRKLIVEMSQSLQYSPDAAFIETRSPWILFVCDDLMFSMRKHQVLLQAGAKRADPNQNHVYAYTSASYVFWKYNAGLNSFAVPVDTPPANYINRPVWDTTGPQAHKIKGEVYKISPEGIFELDEYYRNTLEYERRHILIVVPYHYEVEFPDGFLSVSLRNEWVAHAIMYVGRQSFWNNVLDGSFEPVHKVTPKNNDHPIYYSYTRNEYK